MFADIAQFLGDLNPQLLSTIESEFAKVAGETPPEPTRVGADTVAPAGSTDSRGGKGKGPSGAAAAGGDDPLDELFPRIDLDKLVSGSTIAASGDANWKVRKESLESIQATLEANKRLKPSPLSGLKKIRVRFVEDADRICLQPTCSLRSSNDWQTATKSCSSSLSTLSRGSPPAWVNLSIVMRVCLQDRRHKFCLTQKLRCVPPR